MGRIPHLHPSIGRRSCGGGLKMPLFVFIEKKERKSICFDTLTEDMEVFDFDEDKKSLLRICHSDMRFNLSSISALYEDDFT